jgi:ATP-dependent Clp protease protease subunit
MVDFTGNTGHYKLNEPQMALLKAKVPVIDIVGDVNTSMYGYVRTAVRYLRTQGSPDIDVLISSPGGSVDAGLDIYDELRLYRGEKTATVHDKAASMGALILQACDVRRCAKHSHVLIHHISTGRVTLDTLRSKKKLDDMRKNMESDQSRLDTILAERTGKTKVEIRRVCAKDEFMNADEALAFNLIDEIV